MTDKSNSAREGMSKHKYAAVSSQSLQPGVRYLTPGVPSQVLFIADVGNAAVDVVKFGGVIAYPKLVDAQRRVFVGQIARSKYQLAIPRRVPAKLKIKRRP